MRILLILSCVFNAFCVCAQDINFSQFTELPLLRNPALAGLYEGDLRFTSAFRTQWGSVSTPYRTAAFGTEWKLNINSDDFLNIGAQVSHDVAGDSRLSKTQLLPLLTYNKSLSSARDAYLSLGFMGGFVQQRFDPTQLRFSDQFVGGRYSPANPTRQTFSRTNVIYWDAAVGMSLNSIAGDDIRYYLGAAFFHFTRPKVAFNPANDIRLNRKFVANAGLSANVGLNNHILLYADYFEQGGNSQVQAGFLFSHSIEQFTSQRELSLFAGAYYRWNDAIIPLIKINYGKAGMGFSYDANISKLKEASYSIGGFELALSYRSFYRQKEGSRDKYRCPKGLHY
jgi:type IX secretion system PorP/SprF family membrane protein